MIQERLRKERAETEKAKLEAFSVMCGKNADLEKENKKLREQLDIMTGFCGACKKRYENKLARTREIIKKLLSVYFHLILKTEKARIESKLYTEASELLMKLEEKEAE